MVCYYIFKPQKVYCLFGAILFCISKDFSRPFYFFSLQYFSLKHNELHVTRVSAALCTRPCVSLWEHFLSFLCCRKEKRKRALLDHTASSKQHYVLDKKKIKNPHSNMLGMFSAANWIHSISITKLIMPWSLSMWGAAEHVCMLHIIIKASSNWTCQV